MAHRDPDQDGHDRNVEVPGDTDSADIVGPTGEQMPSPSHDGLELDDLDPVPDDDQDDENSDGQSASARRSSVRL